MDLLFKDLREFKGVDRSRLYDPARAMLVIDSPEERIRQLTVATLIEQYGYPLRLLKTEEPVRMTKIARHRMDVLVSVPKEIWDSHTVTVCKAEGNLDSSEQALVEAQEEGEDEWEVEPAYLKQLDEFELPDVNGNGFRLLKPPASIDMDIDGMRLRFLVEELRGDEEDLYAELSLVLCQKIHNDFPIDTVVVPLLGDPTIRCARSLMEYLGIEELLPDEEHTETFLDLVDRAIILRDDLKIESVYSATGRCGFVVFGSERTDVSAIAWVDFGQQSPERLAVELADGYLIDRNIEPEIGARVLLKINEVSEEGNSLDFRHALVVDMNKSGMVCELQGDGPDSGLLSARRLVVRKQAHEDETRIIGVVLPDDEFEEENPYEEGQRQIEDDPESDAYPFIVVECKAPGKELTEEVKAQGLRYANATKCKYLVLTNGDSTEVYWLGDECIQAVDDLPNYEELDAGNPIEREAETLEPDRTVVPRGASPQIARIIEYGNQGTGFHEPDCSFRPLSEINESLHVNPWPGFEPTAMGGIQLLEDFGLRHHQPGNPSGGTYKGWFRDLLARDDNGNEFIVGFGIFPTKRNYSSLLACISDGAIYHPSLQLNMRDCAKVVGTELRLTHNGRATIGKGSLRPAIVREEIRRTRPSLVEGDQINLGVAYLDAPRGWAVLKDVVPRLAAYAWTRKCIKDKFRSVEHG